MEAVELYLSINGREGTTFKRTARRNAEYVAKAICNKPIASFSSSEAAQFRDWCVYMGWRRVHMGYPGGAGICAVTPNRDWWWVGFRYEYFCLRYTLIVRLC